MWKVSGALGKFFFIAGLMPALAFFAASDLIIVPHFLDGRHLADIKFLAIEGVIYVVGGTFLGFSLLALNTPIIRLYENGLFLSHWLKRRNQERHKQRYTALIQQREAYQQATNDEAGLEEAIAKLEAVHQAIERKFGSRQHLPHDVNYVMPTTLGNAFAVMEEYPYERYGMDVMVYWPRLAAVIPKDYQAQIADLKTTLDFWLNLSLLAGLFGLGAIGVKTWFRTPAEFGYGLLAWVVAYGLYRMAVGAARELGEVVMSCFDLFRGALLEMYGLSKPNSLIAEQRLWRLLASFIRRGEAFYYPAESATDDNRILEGKSQNDDPVA
jgi:hypothetical protein